MSSISPSTITCRATSTMLTETQNETDLQIVTAGREAESNPLSPRECIAMLCEKAKVGKNKAMSCLLLKIYFGDRVSHISAIHLQLPTSLEYLHVYIKFI